MPFVFTVFLLMAPAARPGIQPLLGLCGGFALAEPSLQPCAEGAETGNYNGGPPSQTSNLPYVLAHQC